MKTILFSLITLFICNSQLLPPATSGLYALIADDTVKGYTSNDTWTPNLFDYQISGFNVLWLTFINPNTMILPPAMISLAQCKGQSGCPLNTTKIIVSVGGEAYSKQAWPFLKTQSSAEAMAQTVAQWKTKYNIDGIDLDIEGNAGKSENGGNNILYFAQKLRSLSSSFIITQPVYGYPQIDAENTMVNNGYIKQGSTYVSNGLIDSVGLMVYSNLNSLQYVKDYGNATSEYNGFPITVDVPYCYIIPGIQGNPTDKTIQDMTDNIKSERLGGYMVWYASVYDKSHNQNAFNYGRGDASDAKSSQWATSLNQMKSFNFC